MPGTHTRKSSSVISLIGCLLALVLMVSISILFFPSRARAASGTIVVHTVSSPQIQVGQTDSVTATCGSGEQMVGGGFYGNAFEGAVYITGNYPSTAHAWTVTVDNTIAPDWVQLVVSVYCLQADYSIATTIIHVSGSGTMIANCPTGSALVSGGYASGAGASAPNGNGWQATATDVYALCATQNFIAAPSASVAFSSPGGFGTSSIGTANCGSGQLATGGGFTSVGSVPIINSNGTSTSWTISAAGDYTPRPVTAWAVCVYPPSTGIHVTYHVNGQWPGGFSTTIAITNKDTTKIQGWKVQFSFPGDQTITQLWNGNVSQLGQQVTITSMSYNGTIEPGQTITLGFNGTWKSNNTDPATFLFNEAIAS